MADKPAAVKKKIQEHERTYPSSPTPEKKNLIVLYPYIELQNR